MESKDFEKLLQSIETAHSRFRREARVEDCALLEDLATALIELRSENEVLWREETVN